ncbi:gluconolaconase [Segetibacter sp. 3557_3]|uniref:gluconolaconase n=1 Tax=Segetibacter sp. 3557_3 TaxID=2547429 RepID=UPI0010587139|nr:gluconolaconase [Segetibacter sp. 3557_3]TDH26968.1 gluconolaconase [Segetibacter sp. 3557_3]
MRSAIYIGLLSIIHFGCLSVRPTQRITFTAPDAFPEGIAYDKAADVYYVSSARMGTIGKVTPSGVYTVLHSDTSLKSTYGMKIHPDGKRLFVCASDANYSKYTSPDTRNKMMRLISIDLATGNKVADINLANLYEGKHFANDLVFDDKGNLYLTDSYSNAIIKVDAAGRPSVFSKSPLFKSEGIGLNGLVYHPGGFLLVNSTGKGTLYKVDINNGQNVQPVKSSMYFIGADGMLLNDQNTLTILVNGGNDKVMKLSTEDNWASVKLSGTTLIVDRFTYPATATFKGDEIWVMNANFHQLNDSTAFHTRNFAIQKAVIKPVPKKFSE